jgi:hypothetical protein
MRLDASHFQLVEISLAGKPSGWGPRSSRAGPTADVSRPTLPCGGPRMNPSVDVGNPPQSIRHLRMAERCTPDRIYESGPRSFSIGSKIGDHHHQLCRPACNSDARQNPSNSQEGRRKKLALRLPATFVRHTKGENRAPQNQPGQPSRLRRRRARTQAGRASAAKLQAGRFGPSGRRGTLPCRSVVASRFSPQPSNYLLPARSPPRRRAIAPESYAIPRADPWERSSANSGCANDCRTRACWFQSSSAF